MGFGNLGSVIAERPKAVPCFGRSIPLRIKIVDRPRCHRSGCVFSCQPQLPVVVRNDAGKPVKSLRLPARRYTVQLAALRALLLADPRGLSGGSDSVGNGGTVGGRIDLMPLLARPARKPRTMCGAQPLPQQSAPTNRHQDGSIPGSHTAARSDDRHASRQARHLTR
jgi:hypothetical protein